MAGKTVRWLLNDGVVPLGHIEGCGSDGSCDLGVFVRATAKRANSIDWAYDCRESESKYSNDKAADYCASRSVSLRP